MENIVFYSSPSVVNDGAYKREEESWEGLKARLMSFKRTEETFAQYSEWQKASDPKAKKAKDQGCFVGAVLKDGMRRKANYLGSTLISIDVDEGDRILLDKARNAKFEAVIYTTHSCQESNIRFRMVVPLSRTLSLDEWSRAIHAISGSLGIEKVDSTCLKDCVHAMYWPSASSDGMAESYDTCQEWLDIDRLLSAYPDISSCPHKKDEPQEDDAPKISELEDPSLKPWPVGPFCAVYDIPSAIDKFIPTAYKKFSSSRYTLSFDGQQHEGGGLRLYEKSGRLQAAKAENESDPANIGHDLNSFDLVRIHRFGRMDSASSPKTPVVRRPSYKAMEDLCLVDKAIVEERDRRIAKSQQEALDSYKDLYKEGMKKMSEKIAEQTRSVEQSQDEPVLVPMRFSDLKRDGLPQPTRDNIVQILREDRLLAGAFAYNEFLKQVSVLRPLPWDTARRIDESSVWGDEDDAGLRWYLEKMPMYQIDSSDKTKDAFSIVAKERSFNPVKDFIESKPWDGVKRLEGMLAYYLGCDDTPYSRWLSRLIGEAGIARVYRPGIPFDTMPVLVGRQGCGKSQFCQKLGQRWFTDSIGDITNKDALQSLDGNWVIEFSELKAFSKSDAETYKQFLSSKVDKYRKAYDRRTTFNPRQCIFIGTTNDPTFLKNDFSGYRRFLPIKVNGSREGKQRQSELTPDIVQQIWAEAFELYKSDVELDSLSINEVPDELMKDVDDERTKAMDVSSIETKIRAWLDVDIPGYYYQKNLTDRLKWLGYPGPKETEDECRYDKLLMRSDEERDNDIKMHVNCHDLKPRYITCKLEIYQECIAHRDAMPSPMEENAISNVMKKLVDEGTWEIVSYPISPRGSVYPAGRGYYRRCSNL